MDDQIEKLREQKKQLDARLRKLEAERKARDKKRDMRRKVILGGLLQDWMGQKEATRIKVTEKLDALLKSKLDRELFGLKPLEESSDTKKASGDESRLENDGLKNGRLETMGDENSAAA